MTKQIVEPSEAEVEAATEAMKTAIGKAYRVGMQRRVTKADIVAVLQAAAKVRAQQERG